MDSTKLGICYIAYSRFDKIQRTFSALLECDNISNCDIHVFSDAPFDNKVEGQIKKIRFWLRKQRETHGDITIVLHEADSNLGSFNNISQGLLYMADNYRRIALVEEDVLVNKNFVAYIDKCLSVIEDNDHYFCVSAYNPVSGLNIKSDLFESPRFCCYGLGIFNDTVKKINWDKNNLKLSNIDRKYFNYIARDLSACFYDDVRGKNYFETSWDVVIFYNMLLEKQYEILPKISFCTNIGFDGSGEYSTKGSFINNNYGSDQSIKGMVFNPCKLDDEEDKFIRGFIQDSPKKKMLRVGRVIASKFNLEKQAKGIKRLLK